MRGLEQNIAFPGLGIELELNRVVFYLFGNKNYPIYWYALIIAVAFLLAMFYGMKRSKEFNLTEDDIAGMVIVAFPFAIIFARAYYVIFNFDSYRNDFWKMFNIREGGIAIYGAIIGALIGALIYCRYKKVSIVRFLDVGALGLMIGQAIGRWGNFVNVEAYGGETTLPWRMQIGNASCVHPTFLYESLWNTVGFIVLHFYSKHRKFEGEIFWLYLAWYGIGRAMIEALRTDSLYFFGTGVRVSQVVGIVTSIISVMMLIYKYKKMKMEEKTNECSDN